MEDDSHGICSVTGTDATVFMHGGKRAPTRINALPDGPSIGLTVGYTQIRTAIRGHREVDPHETKQGYPVPGH